MNEFNKGEVWISPAFLQYVVERVEGDKIVFLRHYGWTDGIIEYKVKAEDTLEWRKIE